MEYHSRWVIIWALSICAVISSIAWPIAWGHVRWKEIQSAENRTAMENGMELKGFPVDTKTKYEFRWVKVEK